MGSTLIRMLSTGRVGTKFVAAVFAGQGYHAFHENLYHGEPGSAIIEYIRMLGDMWMRDREKYYEFDSDFAKPYISTVLDSFATVDRGGWSKRIFSQSSTNTSDQVLIHSGHRLTTATPLIEKEAARNDLIVKTLILFRNPLKTIHALYTVESPSSALDGPYRKWASSFFANETFLGAAQIWANTYLMAYDQSVRLADGGYQLLDLERFSNDVNYAKGIFLYLGLVFHEEKFISYVSDILSQPLREAKVDSARNSHIFHNPDFSFSDKEIQQIHDQIEKPLKIYDLDWKEIVENYKSFHEREKLIASSRSKSLPNF
jgi:hypothetical protein